MGRDAGKVLKGMRKFGNISRLRKLMIISCEKDEGVLSEVHRALKDEDEKDELLG